MTQGARPPVRRRRVLVAMLATMAIGAALILDWLRPLGGADGFLVPSRAEAEENRARFAAALADPAATGPAGLVAMRLAAPDAIRVLHEADGDCRGRGAYLLRPGPGAPVAIMAPHRGSDLRTGTIAARLFAETDAVAAAWNSAPRRGGEACPGGDPTRMATHHLTAFALAFAERYPRGRIVQLHGFDPARRKSRAAQLASVIVSAGDEAPPPALYDLADCLAVGLTPHRVAVFPTEVRELGATANAQGRALRAVSFSGFVHLELGPALRRELTGDAALRRAFGACLVALPA